MNKKSIICLAAILFAIVGCGTKGKIRTIMNDMASAQISLPSEEISGVKYDDDTISDTIAITDLNGNPVYLMNALRDGETGEMVATQSLSAAVVKARFRNIAERNGEVEIAFDITIPPLLQDEKWQIRFNPTAMILGDSVSLDQVRITGKNYRQTQLRGYEQYSKYLSSIITNPDELVYTNLLNIFISRNIPELAKLEKDSSFIEDCSVEGLYGVTYDQVKEYYTKIVRKSINDRKKNNREKVFNKLVKDPLLVSGIKIDSVIHTKEEIIYRYSQKIKARPGLKKVEMTLSGSICMDGKELYHMPKSSPISFYISSLTSFTEDKTVYIKKVIERRAQANTTAYITFKTGKYDITDTLYENRKEIERIKENIEEILEDEIFDLDSIVVTASCSPEGKLEVNEKLARKRAMAIKEYFSYRKAEEPSIEINYDLMNEEVITKNTGNTSEIEFKTKYVPEEWELLKSLITTDTVIADRKSLVDCYEIENPDQREKAIRQCPDFKYVRNVLYPKLRLVRFDFFLHRKGMVKDTVHTTEIDTLYQQGLLALHERNYEKAVKYLKPYSDFNAALALVSLDYNASAMAILENLPQSAPRDYMMAIIYSRQGDEQKAVQSYVHSLSQDRSMEYRGNLDPEISRLIKKYYINDE